eukprot:COSAG01_NODE_24288_length_784_cov_0.816058_1_plen_145_part_10
MYYPATLTPRTGAGDAGIGRIRTTDWHPLHYCLYRCRGSVMPPPPSVSSAVYTEHITRQHTRTIHLVRWTRRMSADVSTVPWRSPRSTVRRHERNASIAGEYLRASHAIAQTKTIAISRARRRRPHRSRSAAAPAQTRPRSRGGG